MMRLMISVIGAAAMAVPALAETTDDLRQPALDKCVAAGPAENAAQMTDMCVCLVDGLIAAIPGEDGVKMLKLIIADPTSPEEAAAALGVPAAEAQAFVDAHQQVVGEIAASCVPE